MNMQQETV